MFRIQNQADGKEQDFANQAALLYALEGEEKRCLQLNRSATFHLFHLNKNEEVLESMELTIPSQEDKEVKELLGDFGLKGDDKKAFWQRSQPPKQKQLTESQPRDQATESQTGGSKLLKGLVWLLPVLLSVGNFYFSLQILQLTKAQPSVTPKTETVRTNQKDDVFCRYFIGSYFSQNDSLGDFLAESLSKDDLKTDKVTPVSVLLESQELKGDTAVVTYVINVKDAEDHVSSQRLKLTVQKDREAKYGYVVIKAPQLTAYP
ncbi:hypothetical protein [Streptococcus merionis]|uniref:hypothetical protein n=1 Tax=Streptococcus merionis TaxID=400065 RepID=UPI0035142681